MLSQAVAEPRTMPLINVLRSLNSSIARMGPPESPGQVLSNLLLPAQNKSGVNQFGRAFSIECFKSYEADLYLDVHVLWAQPLRLRSLSNVSLTRSENKVSGYFKDKLFKGNVSLDDLE